MSSTKDKEINIINILKDNDNKLNLIRVIDD